ncbi:hypothetical protein [Halosimplex pelagicum]|uniref:CARDB domain-containing protein n=1 Tax=Halosimplex pelagicum TaxID=869886 RepID=A0A7D5TTB3_9EURY|nr:hypothetical protein [Halosimplex pelagicum]QLH81234.1 hypothetical protein HZS54_06070 [Halosimplex pelagicum]
MKRSLPVWILVVVTLASSITIIPLPATAAQPDAAISNVSLTPSDPAPGEEVTISTTITNRNGNEGAIKVIGLSVQKTVTSSVEAETDDFSEIQPNGSVSIPLSLTFDEPGEKRLTVRAVVRDGNGQTHIYRHPVYVTVEEPDDVQLEFDTAEAVTGGTSVNVTTVNSRSDAISNVQLELGGSPAVDKAERVTASIEGASEKSFQYDVAFDEPGRHIIRGNLTYTIAGDVSRTITESVSVSVVNPDEVSVSFSTTDAAAGDETPVNVTVSNGRSGPISSVQVVLGGNGSVENTERTQASIGSGSQRSFTYNAEFAKVGQQPLTAEVTYRTAAGYTRTVQNTIAVDVEEPHVEAGLSVTTNNSETAVELTNFGNTVFSDIQVTATADGDVIAKRLLADIGPEGSGSTHFEIANEVRGTANFTATYESVGEIHETSTTADLTEEVLGEIRLTSVETMQVGPRVTIEGDASNVGSTDAESVLISIQGDNEGSEYFVGTVEASEFATFELTAQPQGDASAVPIELSYIVDGERMTTTQQVEVESGNSSMAMPGPGPGAEAGAGQGPPGSGSGQGPPGGSGGGLLSMLPVALGVVVIGVVAFGIRRWRQHS